MQFNIKSLTLTFRREEVAIDFADISYFWGQMGAGKTSIAHMIDYCLGGDVELTPAMQSEFVSAALRVSLAKSDLCIERPRDSDRVIVDCVVEGDAYRASIPSRIADGEVIPGTGIEHLSDLLFWLSDVIPPKVRTSKTKQDSELRRLSFRDLFWYCYLDQDSMDSSFFHLDDGAHPFKQLKSRDVIRYVIGFHDEKVAELEGILDTLRGERQALFASLTSIVKVLKEVGVESESQIAARVAEILGRAAAIQKELQDAKAVARATVTDHSVERLRSEARALGDELNQNDVALADLTKALDRDTRHLNELETLSLKYKRSLSAKAVLAGVSFVCCPRCAQPLPTRDEGQCPVCGQRDQIIGPDPTEDAIVERDIKVRSAELKEIIARHHASLGLIQQQRESIASRKRRIEAERNDASAEYDSAYLSMWLVRERERASLIQEADSLAAMVKLARAVESQREQVSGIEARERRLKEELKSARKAAESDVANLNRLRVFYLDCLVRTGIPGITNDDEVQIPTTTFFPHLTGGPDDEQQITSFATISSGGKKNLFKACFAVAMHRVAASVKAPLPELLLIDSAMKNISERENRAQFEGFYKMLYDLRDDELLSTQIILIDKEFLPPVPELGRRVISRHMRPDDPEFPPLIPYYRGK